MYLCARWFRTRVHIPAASAIVDGTPRITKRDRQRIVFTFNIREYIYTRSGSECMHAFPTTTAMADGTQASLKMPEKTNVFILTIGGHIYTHGGSERVHEFQLHQQ